MKKEIQILLQNNQLIAVNKPYGISVHNNEEPENLMQVLSTQTKIAKLFPVHRLDKETSGVQIFALTAEDAANLASEFQNRSVKKVYAGIIKGQLKESAGIWNKPLTDKAEGRKNPEGNARDRVQCETQFRVIKSNQYFTFCEFDLITGRQHQIRKHTAVLNKPLVGDPRYGDPKYNEKIFSTYKVERMFLHCLEVTLFGQKIAAEVPKEFASLI